MPNFVINKNAQSNGDHEVHNTSTGCNYMPHTSNQVDLGQHSNCALAVSYAKGRWQGTKINGCYYCSYSCHTS